ncbi:MAG: hypothetical protein ACXVCY_01965 [Pseudobdellovibrionaceae bacterium]
MLVDDITEFTVNSQKISFTNGTDASASENNGLQVEGDLSSKPMQDPGKDLILRAFTQMLQPRVETYV